MELHNVLCCLSYQDAAEDKYPYLSTHTVRQTLDFNALTDAQRQLRIFGRGVGTDLLDYIGSCYRFVDSSTGQFKHLWDDIYLPMLAWTIHAIKRYHSLVSLPDQSSGDSLRVFSADRGTFLQQVEWSISHRPDIDNAVSHLEKNNVEPQHLCWPGWDFELQPNSSFEVAHKPSRLTLNGELLHTKIRGRFTCNTVERTSSELFSLGLRDGDRIYYRLCDGVDRSQSPPSGPGGSKRGSSSTNGD